MRRDVPSAIAIRVSPVKQPHVLVVRSQGAPQQQSLLLVQNVPPLPQHTPTPPLPQNVAVQVPEQQPLSLVHGCPKSAHVVTHWPFWQVWPEGQGQPLLQAGRAGQVVHFPFGAQYKPLQQLLFVSQPRPARWHLGAPKAVPIPLSPRMPPRVVAAMVLRAWRREVLVARTLVRSSNLVGSIAVYSFHRERVVHSGADLAPGAKTVVP